MIIYHLKSCDTCRKAVKALRDAGHEPELIDVRADGIDRAALEALEASLGYAALVNKKSTTWRTLPDSEKTDLSRETAITLLLDHPTLMKRPVIQNDEAYSVGWSKTTQANYGL